MLYAALPELGLELLVILFLEGFFLLCDVFKEVVKRDDVSFFVLFVFVTRLLDGIVGQLHEEQVV